MKNNLIILIFVWLIQSQLSSAPTTNLFNGHCETCSTNAIVKYGMKHQYANRVPKIIHYVYKTAYIPSQYSPHVRNCMQINKDAKFIFWSDFTAYRFVTTYFQQHVKLYSSYYAKSVGSLKVSDVIRYFILFKFGGIYMDFDTQCQKPFGEAMLNGSCILSQEVHEQTRILWNAPYTAMNSFMATIPNHEFFKYLIGKLTFADSTHILHQTGPFYLTKAFESYSKLVANLSDESKLVSLADPYLYSPKTEGFLEGRCSGNPVGEWEVKGCQSLANHRKQQAVKTSKSFVIHLFMHLGYQFARWAIKNLDNICKTFENITEVWL